MQCLVAYHTGPAGVQIEVGTLEDTHVSLSE